MVRTALNQPESKDCIGYLFCSGGIHKWYTKVHGFYSLAQRGPRTCMERLPQSIMTLMPQPPLIDRAAMSRAATWFGIFLAGTAMGALVMQRRLSRLYL